MSITHVVLIHAAPDANKENLSKIFSAVLGLKNTCTRDGHKYIKSIVGGADNSIEGMQGGITHVMLVEFESEADRDYYAKEDPVHRAVATQMLSAVGTDLVTAQVVDFTPGAF